MREGQDRPRWRAKQRHRRDVGTPAVPDPREDLSAWIDARQWTSCEVETIESLDLTAYLRETALIDLTPAERLRRLAVTLEPGMSAATQPRVWLALERIYGAGRKLDPDDPEIEISRALTAEGCASSAHDLPDVQHRMILVGREAAGRAQELRPDDAAAHYALGMLNYSFHHGSIDAALANFERALVHDPSFEWARLFRAHCLHDLGRWSEAAEAYAEVAAAFFVGPRAWRYDLLREQRAWCLLHAGDREGALAEFLGVLQRYEMQPGLAKHQLLQELTAAAEGPLNVELSSRVDRLRRMIDGEDSREAAEDE